MMRAKRRIGAAEFEAVRQLLKISEARTNAARMALVEGMTLQAIADQYGWTRQAVGDAVNVVWKTLQVYRLAQHANIEGTTVIPPGWEKVTIIAPTEMVERFRSEVAREAQQKVVKKE